MLAGQREITSEQNDVTPSMGSEILFDDDDHIERHRKIGVQKLGLESARLETVFHDGGLEIVLRDVGIIHPFSIFAAMTIAIPRKAQSCIPSQLGDQVQSRLLHHLKSGIVAKMAIHRQVNRHMVAGIRELGFYFGDELAGLLNAESWSGVCDKPGINHHNFSAGFSGRERVTVHGNESGFQDRR